jgi:serine/threonine-protein kinase
MLVPKPVDGHPIVGDVIAGKYRIDAVAGEGGMGIVYEAEHVILRQRVAVKALLPGALSSLEALDRFSIEASAIARIACEHVVRVMDAGTLPNGAPYLVMEYLDGSDLEKLLAKKGPLYPAQVVDFALQALEALAHAHAAHVIHRDLKPANLFLAEAPDGRRIIKLLDFGVAMSVDLSGDDKDRVLGSPRYMSPEQLRKGTLDPRTDLWSLGVVLYELMSGEPPFDGTLSEILTAILQRDPVPLHEKRPEISRELSSIVGRCLERDLAARWRSASELAHALAPHGTGAWTGALARIDRALAKAAPPREPRRFETLETALQALDSEAHRNDVAVTKTSPKGQSVLAPVPITRGPLSTPEAFGATIPAPPSGEPIEVLPVTRAQATNRTAATTLPSAQAPEPGAAADRALRILMIDDSAFVLGVHSEVLKKAGFAVRATTSPREFDELLEGWKPHLVLMDVQMPGMSGDELCRRVKARFKATVPVVFVSDLPKPQLAERAKAGGADAFLSKSSDWARFVDFVRNICAITYSPEDLP